MPGDDLYKKLKEPSPDSFPKFEEESWKKMEVLLDKHLPENDGRVFPYILLLGCIILASLTTFLPARRASQTVEGIANSLTDKPVTATAKTGGQSSPVVDEKSVTRDIAEEKKNRLLLRQNNDPLISSGLISKKIIVRQPVTIKRNSTTLTQSVNDNAESKEFVTNNAPAVAEEIYLTPFGNVVPLKNNNHFLLRTNVQEKNHLPTASNEKKPSVRKQNKNGLSLTFSAGLETPGTGFKTWGRLTPVVGIGVMYNIGEKIILRTGVASASKIYSAHDKDYNPVNNYWASYTYFKRIDADCKIIEIPLGIAYRVLGGKKTNLYMSAGASSIIMRKESYEYYYKNQAGRDTVTNRAWNNNSFHLFSSVNFSAIAERKISNRFSLMAEPGIKIPSGGIGVGKIRLYNAGLTVTAKFKLR